MTLNTGKLELEHLQRLFGVGLGARRDDVVAGPAVGVDCAVVDVGADRCAVLKSDPITFATERIGWYAVHVNANDIATSGADPCWFLSTLLVPPTASATEAEAVFEQIHRAAASLGVAVVGGHTEVTPAVTQVVVAGTMVGFVERSALLLPSAVRPGDVLVVTGGAAIEATAIVANERAAAVGQRLGTHVQRQAAAFLDVPGISPVPAARILRGAGARAMHDATAGGIRAAACEMAQAAGCGLDFDERSVPVHPVTAQVCGLFGLDPLGAIASGALLAAVPAGREDAMLHALRSAGITAAVVGTFTRSGAPCRRRLADGTTAPLVYRPRDEITKLFE